MYTEAVVDGEGGGGGLKGRCKILNWQEGRYRILLKIVDGRGKGG